MRIGIYINNSGIINVDCSSLLQGNPGIGGTEYSVLLLAESLKQHYPEDEIFLYCVKKGKLPAVDSIIEVSDLIKLAEKAKIDKCDVLIMTYSNMEGSQQQEFLKKIDENSLSVITWSHNFLFAKDCEMLYKSSSIKANIFVGKQQYDKYYDHAISKKSKYIYNMYPKNDTAYSFNASSKVVTYIGSLVPSKGFHVLAKQWKKVLQECPDAQLYVIGSGKLYNREQRLGKYKIAEESYEAMFIDSLTDEKGKLLESVHFLGIMGKEKNDVIKDTAVGIVNPTGRTETFGISALDFESQGVPVVTIAKGGFLDTVLNKKTGLLFHSKNMMYKKITSLLKNDELRNEYGSCAYKFAKKFSIDIIVKEWHELILEVVEKKNISHEYPNNYFFADFKCIRVINRKIKDMLRIKYGIALIDIESFAYKIIRGN